MGKGPRGTLNRKGSSSLGPNRARVAGLALLAVFAPLRRPL